MGHHVQCKRRCEESLHPPTPKLCNSRSHCIRGRSLPLGMAGVGVSDGGGEGCPHSDEGCANIVLFCRDRQRLCPSSSASYGLLRRTRS